MRLRPIASCSQDEPTSFKSLTKDTQVVAVEHATFLHLRRRVRLGKAAVVVEWVQIYNLSSRTSLYSSLTRFKNEPGAGAAGLDCFNAGVPAELTTAQDNSITELAVGIRHSF